MGECGAGGGDLGVFLWLSFTALLLAVALLAFGVAQVARAEACAELPPVDRHVAIS